MKLNETQIAEAIALYIHLLEHPEVQNDILYPNEPMCRICRKTALQILVERRKKEANDNCPSEYPPARWGHIPCDRCGRCRNCGFKKEAKTIEELEKEKKAAWEAYQEAVAASEKFFEEVVVPEQKAHLEASARLEAAKKKE